MYGYVDFGWEHLAPVDFGSCIRGWTHIETLVGDHYGHPALHECLPCYSLVIGLLSQFCTLLDQVLDSTRLASPGPEATGPLPSV